MQTLVFWAQRLFFLSALTLLCVVLFAFFAPIFINSDDISQRVERIFFERTGLNLAVNGESKVSFFPGVKVSLRDVKLMPNENRVGDVRIPLAARELTVETGLGSLLFGGGGLKVDSVALESPALYVKRIDMEDYDWDEFARGETAIDFVPVMWQNLYDACNVPYAEAEEWQSAVKPRLQELAVANNTSLLQFRDLLQQSCPDRAENLDGYIFNNWQLLHYGDDAGGESEGDKLARLWHSLSDLTDVIEINNASLIYSAFDKEYSTEMIDAKIIPGSTKRTFQVTGGVQGVRTPLEYSLRIGALAPNEEISLDVSAKDAFSLNVSGKTVKTDDSSIGAQGKLTGKIVNFSELASVFGENSFVARFLYKGGANMEGDIGVDANGLTLKQLEVASDVLVGKGSVSFLYESGREADWKWKNDLSFTLIDMDSLFFGTANDREDDAYYEMTYNTEQISLELPELFSVNASVTIDQIIYHEERINNFILYMDAFRKRAVLHRFEFSMPGNSYVSFTGSVEHNKVRPIFKGFANASGEKLRDIAVWVMPELNAYIPVSEMNDFNFDAKLQITPVSLMIDEAILSFDNASVRGAYGIDYIDASSAENITVSFDRINFDRYGLTDLVLKKIRDIEDSQFFDGATLESYILNLTKQMHLTARGEDIVFNDHRLRYAEIMTSYGQGKFSSSWMAKRST